MKIYDFAIAQCKNRNIEKTNKALMTLQTALRYDDKDSVEISNSLRSLYEFCQDQMRQRNYNVVERILTELRDSWHKAFRS